MKKALTFLFSAILFAATLFAGAAGAQAISQDSLIQQKLLTPYAQYFEFPAEGIYTHFNKNAYMTGEGVWFKIYLMDIGEKRPFDLAQNVYAELFDPAGKAVDKQVLFAEKGSASGMFHLADTLVPGTYTFRAYTNWMRNMDDHVFYTRTFKISGGVPRPAGDAQATGDYDIQFFPEGGTLLEGIPNAVAFKIVNPQGKGESLKGILRSGAGDTLLQLAAGPLGMSSLQLTPQPGTRYTADFFLPGGNVKTVELPSAQQGGISVSAQWFFPDKVSVLLRTNPQSLAGLNGKQFYLLVHNRGQVAQMLIVKWTTRPLLKIDMDKSLLLNGINHVTLFDEHFQPVASRMIFNQKKAALGQLAIQTQLEGDSLAISLAAKDLGGQPLEADMSISFLPGETRRGTFETSIYTALLLESDLQGPVENAAWYFDKEGDFERLRGLDYLLLTQGWRAYDWEKIAKGKRPEPVHEFEQGFTITGEVVNSISRNEMGNSQVSLFSPGNGIMTLLEVDSSGAFTLPKAFLLDSSRVIVNATNAKGRSGFRELKATVTPPRYEKATPALPLSAPAAPGNNTSLVLPGGSELLEAVTVTGQAKTPEEKAFAGDTYYSAISDRVVVITKENYFKYNSLRDMLMKEFNFVGNSLRGGGPPVLIVDGTPMDDLTWLDGIHISEVEAVAVNKSGNAMLGQRGANGSINIKTRTRAVDWGPRRDLNIVRLLVDGFSAPVAYYSPKYEVPASESDFRERAAIYWKPDVTSDSFGNATFKFALPSGLDSLHIRTEGISSAGVLMVDEQVIGIE